VSFRVKRLGTYVPRTAWILKGNNSSLAGRVRRSCFRQDLEDRRGTCRFRGGPADPGQPFRHLQHRVHATRHRGGPPSPPPSLARRDPHRTQHPEPGRMSSPFRGARCLAASLLRVASRSTFSISASMSGLSLWPDGTCGVGKPNSRLRGPRLHPRLVSWKTGAA
jgi:hypothetical protein